jgi:hypothetical protein
MHALRNLLWPKHRDETQGVELSGGCKAAALELDESQRDRRGVVAVATAEAAEQQPQPGSSMEQQPAQVHPGWALSAPSTARLVLSVCREVAEQQQQEALLAAGSWQAACEQCRQQLLLR